MKRFLQNLRGLFYPNGLLLTLLMLVSAAGLAAVFLLDASDTAFAYAVFPVSAYTLSAAVLRIPPLARRAKARLHRNAFLRRYAEELPFRAEVSLYFSFAANLLYALLKAAAALRFRSGWFGALAFYYASLGTMRFLLLRRVRNGAPDPLRSFQAYRAVGFLLLTLTAAVGAMAFTMLRYGAAPAYPGHLIFAVAAYTFFSLGSAITSIVRYRKLGDPIHSAGKAIALASALISLFSLQAALLAAFGHSDDAAWQRSMHLATGLSVFLLISGIASFMIATGSRAISKCKATSSAAKKD